MKSVIGALVLLGVSASLAGGSPSSRSLTFEDRVRAQEAIERLYYSHQIGATKPFEQAVPREVLERRVQTYLKQSVALEDFWHTPVTAGMLERELERMVRGTRMPERLLELYAALDNDPLLILECLVRPALVDRLTRDFFASDERIHGNVRKEAETLRGDLIAQRINPYSADPRRTLSEITREIERLDSNTVPSGGEFQGHQNVDVIPLKLSPEKFDRCVHQLPQGAGAIGPLVEQRDRFEVPVVVERETDRVRVVSYRFQKTSWGDWWAANEPRFSETHVATLAPNGDHVFTPAVRSVGHQAEGETATLSPCDTENMWDNGILDNPTHGRTGHTSVWTGSLMLVWGGAETIASSGGVGPALFNTGGRYDPAIDTWTPTSSANAPSARNIHTSVWAGNVMLVWGGFDNSGAINTGGQYDPSTDTWTPISTADAPSARFFHTAVWTGSLMVVWGGLDSGDYLDTGGRYDPTADTWTPTSTTNAPSARSLPTAIWTGSLMVVWGGQGMNGDLFNTGGRYDPATDTWAATSTTAAPLARASHTSIWTGSLMLVWGGGNDTGGRYDPLTDTWTPTSTTGAPSIRIGHTAVWTGSLMVVWGGIYSGELDTGGRYDPVTDTWTPTSTANAPSARYAHTAVWTGSLMIVWGGNDRIVRGGYGPFHLNTGGRYDPATDTWTPSSTTNAPSPRQWHTAVWTGTEMIVWGGFNLDFRRVPVLQVLNTGGRYDPATDTWTPTSTTSAPSARFFHTAVWTGGLMVVWGGTDIGGPLDTGGRYDPATDTWMPTSATNVPSARVGHTAVQTGNLMVVWGGGSDTGGRYDPATDTWTPTSTTNAPTARISHSAVWTGSRMVVWGGNSGSAINTGGRYDPATDTWMPTSTTDVPSAREFHTAVWTGSRMVVWGGSNSGVHVDTGGRYDPTTDVWMPTSTANAPSARSKHTALWTGDVTIVWGGSDVSALFNTGGRYNPATDTWTPTSTTDAPSGRNSHTAAWTGSLMVVWGGAGDGGDVLESGGRYVLGVARDNDGDTFTECQGDCDDMLASVYPGAPQLCDGLNNDCGHPSWPSVAGTNEADYDGDSFTECQGDCDGSSPTTFPGAPELCDDLDNDCDMIVDNGDPGGGSACGSNIGTCRQGVTSCTGGTLLCVGSVGPMAEVCDGLDDDCDGVVPASEADADADRFLVCQGDCNDGDSSVHPGAAELPGNAADENCDGELSCDPARFYKTHGEFVRCVSRACGALVTSGSLTQTQCKSMIVQAAQSNVGRKLRERLGPTPNAP